MRFAKNIKTLVIYISARYHKNMSQVRLLLVLICPSWLSFSLTAFTTCGLITFSNWTFLAASPVLFETFYGEHGVITTLERSPNAVAAVQNSFSNNPVFYDVGLASIAVIAALGVFIALRSVEHGFGALQTIHEGTPVERHEKWQHGLVRTAVLVLWALYVLFTVHYAVPFCLLLWRIGVEDISWPLGLITSALVAALLFVVLHGHVIFARLFYLRPRTFGGNAVVESALIH